MEHIAKLKKVTVISHGPFHLAWGHIFDDKADHGNHPLPDDAYIHTSTIKDIVKEGEDTYIVTRNSTYKVEGDIGYQGAPFTKKVD